MPVDKVCKNINDAIFIINNFINKYFINKFYYFYLFYFYFYNKGF